MVWPIACHPMFNNNLIARSRKCSSLRCEQVVTNPQVSQVTNGHIQQVSSYFRWSIVQIRAPAASPLGDTNTRIGTRCGDDTYLVGNIFEVSELLLVCLFVCFLRNLNRPLAFVTPDLANATNLWLLRQTLSSLCAADQLAVMNNDYRTKQTELP